MRGALPAQCRDRVDVAQASDIPKTRTRRRGRPDGLRSLYFARFPSRREPMQRTGKAAVCRELNKPVVVETIRVEGPKRGEVTIRIAACGVCHSDLSATNGTIPLPPPLVLGHEAAGEVVEVGEGVSTL